MEINATIIFCDKIVDNLSNGRITPSISNPFKSITPINIPGNYTFSIFFSIENIPIEKKELQITLYDTNNIKVLDTNIINLQSFNTINNVYAPVVMAAEIRNAIIEKTGCFTAEIKIDNQLVAKEKLEVNTQI